MDKWPTIADLAKADIEQVNAAWRGLGYYRRARSLLKGAQTVMGDPKYNGQSARGRHTEIADRQAGCPRIPRCWRSR
jgi:adenine-specific DNA glycosylase